MSLHRQPPTRDLTPASGPGAAAPGPASACVTLPGVTLTPMTPQDLESFVEEEVADYADERVRDGTWSRGEAIERSRVGLARVIAWEHEALTAERQRLLTARDDDGKRVGWLWVKLGPAGPWSTSAFLCQMTVARAYRHRGFGRSMLAALESLLASAGITDLRLNVYESNLPAKCLYAAAGYELSAQCPTMRQLRKHLEPGAGERAAGSFRTGRRSRHADRRRSGGPPPCSTSTDPAGAAVEEARVGGRRATGGRRPWD